MAPDGSTTTRQRGTDGIDGLSECERLFEDFTSARGAEKTIGLVSGDEAGLGSPAEKIFSRAEILLGAPGSIAAGVGEVEAERPGVE